MATRREGATGRFVRTTGWAQGGGSAGLGTGGHKRRLLRELGTGQTPCHGHRGAQPIVSLLWVPFYPSRGAQLSRAAPGGQQAPAHGSRCWAAAFGPHLPPSPRLEHQRATRRGQEPSQGTRVCGGNHSPPSLLLGTASHVLPHQTLPGTTPGKTTPQGHPSDPGVPSCWGQRPPRPPPAYPRRNVALPSTFFPFFHILSHAGQGRNGNSAPGRAAPLPAAPPRGRHRGQGTKESSRREASVGASREQHPSTFHGETLDVIRAED